jgi:hypothetical protein
MLVQIRRMQVYDLRTSCNIEFLEVSTKGVLNHESNT